MILLPVAVAICGHAEGELKKDDSRIVADEYLTFPIAVFGLPYARNPMVLAGAFVTSRIMDRLKPPPARQAARF